MGTNTLQERIEMVASYAPEYQSLMFEDNLQKIGLAKQNLREGGAHPIIRFLLRYHAFARAGGEQAGYGSIAHTAFKELDLTNGEEIPPAELWNEFRRRCEHEGIGVNEPLNKGVVTGLAKLANRRGNIFLWVRNEVDATGELRPVFLEVEDITGIGRKIATFILRDIVWFWDIEDRVEPHDRKYLHPIDRWVSRVALNLWPELEGLGRSEIAQNLGQECTDHGISNAEFNQGAWYLGARALDGDEDRLEAALQRGVEI